MSRALPLFSAAKPPDWRLQLALVLAVAILLRAVLFVGFGLGDDLGYVGHADEILRGRYPPLDLLNQYAYRPLLLYLYAGGIALFGHTDLGVAAPALLAALVTTAVVFAFVRTLIDPAAAWWCALLFAVEPFNVVNSTTMTNDVVLSCLAFASLTVFLVAERGPVTRRRAALFVAAAALMVAAYLVKITIAPVVCAMALYSLVTLARAPALALRGHGVFYGAFLAGILCVCLAYYLKTGDWLWQFRAETFYYTTYKPVWYLAGEIDYWALMSQYPRSLFGLSGVPGFRYLDHGLMFWAFVPAAAFVLIRPRHRALAVLVALAFTVFAFFQFYPQYVSPHYLPLVRQDRYLELLIPPAVVVVGTMLYRLSRARPALAAALLCLLVADSVVEAARRSTHYRDSQADVRSLAAYVESTIARGGRRLAVDLPAKNALAFYAREAPVAIEEINHQNHMSLREAYVAVGGARSFWWSSELTLDVREESPPGHWLLTYEVPRPLRPWRRSPLRVYYAGQPDPSAETLFEPPGDRPAMVLDQGLVESAYPDGFDAPGTLLGTGRQVADLDNRSVLAASRLQWDGWLRAEDGAYTFETSSDDGSWLYVNDRLLLDNGGTHPARTERRTVRLGRGWYRFRLRYEDTGGDRLLRLRIFKDHLPARLPPAGLFFSAGARSTRQSPDRGGQQGGS